MNIHQARQLIENNFWHGENFRRPEPGRLRQATASLIQPDYSRNWGCDVSDWDGRVDLSVTKSKGASFVIIKAIDGTVLSRHFPENYARAVAAGLARSAYAWLYRNTNVSCVAQAQAYNTLMNKYPPSFGPAIDFESTKWGGVSSNPTFTDLRIWITEWLRLGNPKPYLYSGKYFMNQYGEMPNDLKDMFAGLWIANYGTVSPGLPLGWVTWKLWQFTSSGDAQLLAPNSTNKFELDLNYEKDAVTIPPGGSMPYKKATGNMSIRTGASTTFPKATIDGVEQYVLTNDIIEVGAVQTGFAEIKKLYRNNVSVALPPVAWCGTLYLADTTYTPPDPQPTVSPVVYTSQDTDLINKTISYTRRRKDGQIDIIRDPIE